MYIEGDVPVVTTGNNNNNGWNDWSWIIGLAVVGGIFGNGGFGFGGNGGRGFGIAENYALSTDFATLERKLDGVNNGLCDGFYAQNTNTLNGFASVQQTLCQGFNGIERSIDNVNSNLSNAICTLGYRNQEGFNQISNLIQSCCCDLKTMNLENRYLNERQTCDIVNAINAGNQRLVDIYTNDKLDALRSENASLKGQISNDRQSRFIIDELRNGGCPIPSYVVQPSQPVTFPTDCCGTVNLANFNKGCGCC